MCKCAKLDCTSLSNCFNTWSYLSPLSFSLTHTYAQTCTHAHAHAHTDTYLLHILLAKPNSSNLTVIKWKNERGEVKKFKIKSSIIHRWRKIGNLVVPRQQLLVWAKRMDDEECCEAVLSHWLDHPPSRYPATWEGLYELLDDSELGQVAIELKEAVDNAI